MSEFRGSVSWHRVSRSSMCGAFAAVRVQGLVVFLARPRLSPCPILVSNGGMTSNSGGAIVSRESHCARLYLVSGCI